MLDFVISRCWWWIKYWCWCGKQPQWESSQIAEGLVSGGLQGLYYLVLKWTLKSLALSLIRRKRPLRLWIHMILQFKSMLLASISQLLNFNTSIEKLLSSSKLKSITNKFLNLLMQITIAKRKCQLCQSISKKITIGNDLWGVRLPSFPSQKQIQIQIQIYLQDYHRKRPMWSQAAIPPIPNTNPNTNIFTRLP